MYTEQPRMVGHSEELERCLVNFSTPSPLHGKPNRGLNSMEEDGYVVRGKRRRGIISPFCFHGAKYDISREYIPKSLVRVELLKNGSK